MYTDKAKCYKAMKKWHRQTSEERLVRKVPSTLKACVSSFKKETKKVIG